ncbi:hypothetical protein [Phaeobacter sp. B1627]|uniref:hypothetical protein n=1 Tax=Phaeobacter sp. B1627 TaxID=2583809 RepID=UPI00210239B3|nr:hypothetical protein [Phaeobacter sp. B1627]
MKSGQSYVARMRSDGLIVVEPRKVVQSRIALRSLVLFVAAVLMFKGLLMASIGFDSYNFRVAELRKGTPLEQGGALIMQSDPLSASIAEKLVPLFR